jgi:putative addiction module component (TIGR02574 family)
MTNEQLEQELLRLPAAERARLAERLISSLDDDEAIENAWMEEVRRRDEELESGQVQALPLEDALTSVRTRFGW